MTKRYDTTDILNVTSYINFKVMTIEEKAKEFAGLNSDSKDVLADLFKSLAYKGYMAGAEWMLAKATAWIVK
mgnify:CR=1 FL=1